MSLAALTAVIVHIVMVGTAPEPDEGAGAHIRQILMGGQLPIIAPFAIKWIPRAPGPALGILALQAATALAALAPVYFLHWLALVFPK
jgi:hypothetical protein